MSRRRSRPVAQPSSTPTCCFCGTSDDDEVQYGKLWSHDGILTHYYCLLLSSNMEQNGKDNEGILGFMTKDIQKELRRGKKLICSYCKRSGATLGCCNTKCKRVFHLPCGLQSGSLHQFFGEYRSYCIRHRITQNIDEHIKVEAAAAGDITCYICYEEVNPQNTIRTLWAPCCRKNAWFHRNCVQRLALSAGYFFKCPLCNNRQEFLQAMLDHGIFIPSQDASWELVPNAYQELLHRHDHCDAAECLCPKGRTHTSVNAKWELVLCRLCGSQGVHRACGHLKWANSAWECAECIGMLQKSNDSAPRVPIQAIESTKEVLEDEHESSSDSDISVGRNPSPLLVTERPESPPLETSPIKLRPGPRSFKLLQSMRNAKSAASAVRGTPHTYVPENSNISLSSGSKTDVNTVSDEKCNEEVLQVKNSPTEKGSSSAESACVETKSSDLKESNALLKKAYAESIEPKHRVADVIVIDSDDEIEIVTVKPKRKVLTVKDGTEIQIHNVHRTTANPHKVEGDVKVFESTAELSRSSLCQAQKSPATNGSITSDACTILQKILNTCSATVTAPATRQLHPLNVPESPVLNRNDRDVLTEKEFKKTGDPELMVINEVQKIDSIMNLKITNVTSLRLEDFTNTFQELDVIKKAGANNVCSSGIQSDLLLKSDHQIRIPEETGETNSTSKSCSPRFQHNSTAIRDLNTKRKSDEYDIKIACNSLDKNTMECYKRARISKSDKFTLVQKNTNVTCNVKKNDVNRGVPIHATSIICSGNSYKLEECAGLLKVKPNELQTGNNDGIRMICNPIIQKRNSFHKHPTGTSLPGLVQNEVKKSANYAKVPNAKLSPIRTQQNSVHTDKMTKLYGTAQPQIAKHLSFLEMASNINNVQSTPNSGQQPAVNGSQNLTERLSRWNELQVTVQNVPKTGVNAAIASQKVYQPPKNTNRQMQRHNESGQTLITNLSANDASYNGPPRTCAQAPTGSNGNQPIGKVSTADFALVQLANGISVSSGCDGDAGSSPAAEAGFTRQTTSRSSVHVSAQPITFADSRPDSREIADPNSIVSTNISANPTNCHYHSSPTTPGKHCDKPRIIPKNVPLQNVKFRVLDSDIVQINVDDTLSLKISADTGNLQNIQNVAGPKSSKQKVIQSSARLSSSSFKFYGIGKNRSIYISKECGSPNAQSSNEITRKPTKFTSVSKRKLDNSGISSTAAIFTNSETKALSDLKTREKVGSKISDSNSTNQASSPSDKSFNRMQNIDSVTEISSTNGSSVCSSFEGSDRNSCCVRQVENSSREETVLPAFSDDGLNSKTLRERDDNIISVGRREDFSKNVKITSVKTFKDINTTRNVSCDEFCSKPHNLLNDKRKNKTSNRFSRASKCPVRNLQDSLELNLPNNSYNNFRNIVDRGSELDCNTKDLDANIQDSLRSSHIADLGVKDRLNKVSSDRTAAKSNKYLDTPNSGDFQIQAGNMNCISNTSCAVLNCERINSDVSHDKLTKKSLNTAVKDEVNFCKHENGYSSQLKTCASDISIKVKIDLSKIQHFIDRKPQLFKKYSKRKSERVDEHVSESLPILLTSQSFQNAGPTRRLRSFKTQRKRSVKNTDDSNTGKRFKYNSEFFKEHLKS